MEYVIRPARSEDAEGIIRVIISALRETNAKDYSQAVIARVEGSFSPAAVLDLLERRTVFVAIVEDNIVGTASLDGEVVRTVFILPEYQGRGIGRALMARVERAAIAANWKTHRHSCSKINPHGRHLPKQTSFIAVVRPFGKGAGTG